MKSSSPKLNDTERIPNGKWISPHRHVRVRYTDHIIFRNADVSTVHPCVRDASGWIVREDEKFIVLCSDIPSPGYEYMSFDIMGSGLAIIRECIKEIKPLESS